MATATDYKKVDESGKPLDKAKFRNKKERKAYRKTLRSVVANKIVDKQLDRKEKQKYYASLRLVKIRRRKVADDMQALVDRLCALGREVDRVNNRVRGSNPAIVAAASGLVDDAIKSARQKAGQYAEFARKQVLRYKPHGKK